MIEATPWGRTPRICCPIELRCTAAISANLREALKEQHLMTILHEFVGYFNQERPDRTLGLETPERRLRPVIGAIRSHPMLNGLHHIYERTA